MRRYTVTVDGTPFTLDVEETAADRFTVTVGGHTFAATLEAAADLPGSDITPGMPGFAPQGTVSAAPARAQPATQGASRPTARPAAAASIVAAPMPGVVLEVRVRVGEAVRRGDALLVLEAMKMRNTIRAPRDGTVVEVVVEAGRPVGAGEPLVRVADPAP